MTARLLDLLSGPAPVRAPLALSPLMAKLAEKAGFEAVYLGGGGLGYQKVFLEGNLSLTEVAQLGTELASTTALPVIADIASGWGDPMHLRRTVAVLEAAGVAAVELEDGRFPKPASHHVGHDEVVPQEVMEAKIRSAVAARRDDGFLVIARVTAGQHGQIDEVLRRAEAYRAAGADVLLPLAGVTDAATLTRVGEQLGPPLMYLAPPGGLASVELSPAEMHAAGYRLLADAMSLHVLVYETLRRGYEQLAADGFAIEPGRTKAEWWALLDDMHASIDLETLLDLER